MTLPNILPTTHSTGQDEALCHLLQLLAARNYAFVTPTPTTHARVVARSDYREAADLRGVFGWSLPFRPETIEPEILTALTLANGMAPSGAGLFKSSYRVSSLGPTLIVHSAYPTDAEDAVFFGPDSYRFAAFVERELAAAPVPERAHLVDLGAGAGVGAIAARQLRPDLRIIMTDLNPKAIRLARINARAAQIPAEFVVSASLTGLPDPIDVVIANPPYIVDASGRDYRDGGDMHGARVAVEMAEQTADRLAPGGRMLLYTGSAIVGGRDALHAALEDLAARRAYALHYRELDPDVFGEELDKPPYRDVERIALIGATLVRAG